MTPRSATRARTGFPARPCPVARGRGARAAMPLLIAGGLVAFGVAPAAAASELPPVAVTVAEAGDGGGAGAVAADDDPVAYYTGVMLMLAHLRLGNELYRVGQREAGREHFIAPARDRLPSLREAMRARGLERVVDRVEELAARARESDSWIDIQDLHEATRMSLQRAAVEVEPSVRETAAFKARVILAIARSAIRAHERAVDDGEIVDAEAYRTAYGYARQGRRLLRDEEGALSLPDDALYADLVERYDALREAWPSARPPGQPPVPVAEVRERADALAAAVEAF